MYIEFYDYDLAGELHRVCGDRGVIKLDGRESRDSHLRIAEEELVKRGFKEFRFVKSLRGN